MKLKHLGGKRRTQDFRKVAREQQNGRSLQIKGSQKIFQTVILLVSYYEQIFQKYQLPLAIARKQLGFWLRPNCGWPTLLVYIYNTGVKQII